MKKGGRKRFAGSCFLNQTLFTWTSDKSHPAVTLGLKTV